jgi:hypothetical protein
MAEIVRDDFAFAAAQYTRLLESIRDETRLPRGLNEDGTLRLVPPRDWTSGFFAGCLWLVYDFTRAEKWRTAAEDYTARVEGIKDFTDHHDVGFMLGSSFGQGLRLTGNPAYHDVLLQGAQSVSTRFDPALGVMRSWDANEWKYPVIVDNMMNLELLLWAAQRAGDSRLRELSVRHADQTLLNHYRPDGSSFHLVSYDPATGGIEKKQTVQGAADDSTWARGQSWGFYGFTMMYRMERNPRYLEHAQKIADFLINHPRLPADKIPYWDYDAPDIPNEPRDTSAAAIMCSALIELSSFVPPEKARSYLAVAEQQLRALSSSAYRAAPGENANFVLMHGVGHNPGGTEIDVPLVYGDYYFLEALLRWQEADQVTYP